MAYSVNNTNSESYGGDMKGNGHHHLELYRNCTEQNNNHPLWIFLAASLTSFFQNYCPCKEYPDIYAVGLNT